VFRSWDTNLLAVLVSGTVHLWSGHVFPSGTWDMRMVAQIRSVLIDFMTYIFSGDPPFHLNRSLLIGLDFFRPLQDQSNDPIATLAWISDQHEQLPSSPSSSCVVALVAWLLTVSESGLVETWAIPCEQQALPTRPVEPVRATVLPLCPQLAGRPFAASSLCAATFVPECAFPQSAITSSRRHTVLSRSVCLVSTSCRN
jgi:hypothetical protein